MKRRVRTTNVRSQVLPKTSRRRPAPPVGQRELAALIAPISVATFFRDYWQKKPLYIPGNRRKLERVLPGGYARRDLIQGAAISAERHVPGYSATAHQTAGFDHPGAQSIAVTIEPSEIEERFASGCNVQIAMPWDERVMTLLSRVKTQVACAGESALFATLSPAGFGWPPHIDNVDVFFVQTEGHKRLLIGDAPVFEYPRGTVTFAPTGEVARYEFDATDVDRVDPIDVSALREIVLAPGDVFYCPPGVVHGTKAIDETLTLLLALKPRPALDIIQRTLAPQLTADPSWRNIPAARPAELQTFLEERLVELRRAVTALTPEALHALLAQAVAFPGKGVQMGMRDPSRPTRALRKTDRFRIGSLAPLTWAHGVDRDGAPAFFVFSGDRELSVGGEWIGFVERLVQLADVRAGETLRWNRGAFAWADVKEIFAALMENGVVDLVD